MSKLSLFIISSIFLLIGLFGVLHTSDLSSLSPVQSISANLDTGSSAPTFTPTPTGIGSSAPTYTPTPTFTLTPTSTPTNTPTNTPTTTPTLTPTPTPIPYTIVIDNTDVGFYSTGVWKTVTNGTGFIGSNYLHDNNNQKGKKTARWALNLPIGTYQVSARYVSSTNRASNVPYVTTHQDGTSTVIVNQQMNGGQWVSIGTYDFNGAGSVSINTANTNGFVVADAVRFEQVF